MCNYKSFNKQESQRSKTIFDDFTIYLIKALCAKKQIEKEFINYIEYSKSRPSKFNLFNKAILCEAKVNCVKSLWLLRQIYIFFGLSKGRKLTLK